MAAEGQDPQDRLLPSDAICSLAPPNNTNSLTPNDQKEEDLNLSPQDFVQKLLGSVNSLLPVSEVTGSNSKPEEVNTSTSILGGGQSVPSGPVDDGPSPVIPQTSDWRLEELKELLVDDVNSPSQPTDSNVCEDIDQSISLELVKSTQAALSSMLPNQQHNTGSTVSEESGSSGSLPAVHTGVPTAQTGTPTTQIGTPTVQIGVPTAQTGTPTVQIGVPTAQTGTLTAHTGASTVQTGVPTAQTGTLTAHTGASTVQTGVPTAQTWTPTAPIGTPTTQTGTPTAQTGTLTAQTGTSTVQTGVPTAPIGTSTTQTGTPTVQIGVPTAQTGTPTVQTGAQTGTPTVQTGAQTGTPTVQTGVPTVQTGVPTAQTGTPTLQTGVPTAQTGVPTAQTGVPTAQTGTPTVQTEVPTAQTGTPSSLVDDIQTKTSGVNIGEILKLSPEALTDLVRSIAMAQLRVSASAAVQSTSQQPSPAVSSTSHQPAVKISSPSLLPKTQQASQSSLLKPQPLTITLPNGSKLNLSSLSVSGKSKPGASIKGGPQSSVQTMPAARLASSTSTSITSTTAMYPGMSLGETCFPYPRLHANDISLQQQKKAAAPITTDSTSCPPVSTDAHIRDSLHSLAMIASLVPKVETSGDIDVGEPVLITPLPLPECLADHNYTVYNPEFSHPKMYMEVDKSLTATHIPGTRLSYAPGVPQQHLTLQKMLKLSQKMKAQREIPEREKKIPKKQKATVVTAKIRKKEMVEEGSSEEDNGEEDDSNSRRRSARNLGRRKRYVDDIDVNLSDYEEEGDSDDERQKAYKKKKYGLKDEVEADSDGERPSKVTQTQRLQTQQPQSVTNYTDGLVQASVYYEPPEEEAQVVEKILGLRTRPSRPEEKVYGENIEEYLVKYKNFSYLHVQWGTFPKLIKGDKRFDQKLKRYKQKQEQLGPFVDVDDEPFNPDYTVAERVLDMATQEEANGEVVTHLLVKWKSLPYEDSTWELEEDIDRDKVDMYLQLQEPSSRSVTEFHPRPAPSDFRPIKESPKYRLGNLLRPYQLEGLNWLLFNWYTRQNCILADEMGLGKTVQSIAFLMSVKDAGIQGPFLVIAPLTTITNWQREFEAWADFNVVVYHGSLYSRNLIHEYELYYRNAKGRIIPGAYKFNVIITTYEVLLAPQCELRNIQWRLCIIDEAHRLKNRNCKILEELKHIHTEHRVLLTGTPLQNSVEELFSLLNFLEPIKFPSEETFLMEYGNLKTEEEVEKLKSILRPMMLRRLKEDVEKSLAPKEETIVEVELTGIQKQYYRAILEKNFNFLSKSGGANVPSLLNTMMELRKCCNHPFLIKGAEQKIVTEYVSTHPSSTALDSLVQSSGKVVLIDKLLPKLKASGHKVLIFSQMVKCLDILEDYLRVKGYLYERIDGQIRGILRQAAIDRFSKPDSDRFVFLLCTRAGGLGINLTAADTVIIYDSDWNPQNDIQAQSRCHRIGQNRMVKVYRLITRNSYEREMFDRASLKLGLDRALLQSMAAQKDSNSSQLGKREIEDLLKKGAYAALMDENDDSEKFCQEDIDQILERRTKVIQLDSEAAGSTFSKASFVADGSSEDLDINDPEFWQKWAEKAKLDLNQLASKDNLILDQPRQRRQTRRFGNDSALADDVEEEEVMELVPARGKKGWTKLELQKVERYLLIYGWNQWRRILHSGFKGKKIRLGERDIENMSRTILVYCLHHFKGDEKARPLIHRLIDPSEEAPGKPDLATLHANPFAFTEDDYLALMAKDPESLFQEEVYKKHLKKHANRIILRVRQLHIIRWDIFGDHLEKIKQGVPAKDIRIQLAIPEDPPPVEWWHMEADKSLLIGTIKYGYEQYGLMRSDPTLCFKAIVGAEPVIGRANLRSTVDDGSLNPLSGYDGGDGDSLGEDDGPLDSDEDALELDLVPRKLPRMKRTPVKLPLVEGQQVWPTVADLNTRLRRLVSAYLKSQRQQVLKMEKMKKQQARREKEKEASRQRELKRAELAQKWSRREEQDFARVIAFFGVIYDRECQSYNWDRFRQLANLGKKSNDRLTTYYIDFRNMCQRVINGQRAKKGKSGHVLERVTEDRASKCLQRIDVLSAIREEVLSHPDFPALIKLCEASFEVPHWWIPVTHDVDLLKGVDRHGLARSEHLLYPDPEFSFISTVPKSALFTEQDKPEYSDTSDSEEKMETADDSVSADVIASSGGSGQEREPRATSGSQSLGVPIGWPKEKAIVMRLTRIVFAFRNGYWPKPMEGLELFAPKRQEMEESEEEVISDLEDTFNTSSDFYDHSMEYMVGDYGDTMSEDEEDELDDYSTPDSDSDYCVDVEESNPVSWSTTKRSKSKRVSHPSHHSTDDPPSAVSFSVNKGTDLKLTIKRSLLSLKTEKEPTSLIVSIPRVLLTFPTRAGLKKIPKIPRKRKANKEAPSRAKSRHLL